MTPELETAERIFRRIAIEAGRPWPPDRWLGARARGAFVSAHLELLRGEAERKLDELEAIRSMHEIVRDELGELLELLDAWCFVGERLALVAVEEEARSPWASLASVPLETDHV